MGWINPGDLHDVNEKNKNYESKKLNSDKKERKSSNTKKIEEFSFDIKSDSNKNERRTICWYRLNPQSC